MAACTYHPYIETGQSCTACARPFCEHCLADIMGQRLCGECKQRAVQGMVEQRQRHPQATLSVVVPVVGYLTCVLMPVTSIVGIVLGRKVLRDVAEQPHLSGRSAGLAALVISVGTLATLVIGIVGALILRVTG